VPNKAGINNFAWNMRYPDASSFNGLVMWAAGTQGPMAPPGTYQVRMSVDGKPVGTETFALKKDPRTKATQADLAAQFAFLEQVRTRTSQANDGVKAIRSVRSQLADREAKLNGQALSQFRALAEPFRAELASVEDSLYQTKNRSGQDPLNYPIRLNNKLAALAGVAGSAEARPTDQTVAVFKDLSAQLDVQLARMKRAMDGTLPKINAILTAAGQPVVAPKVEADPGADAISDDDTDF
jgi:small-conductance mechanosensitive channel